MFSMFARAIAKLIHPNKQSGSNFVCLAIMLRTADSANLPILVNSLQIKLITALLLLIPGKIIQNIFSLT